MELYTYIRVCVYLFFNKRNVYKMLTLCQAYSLASFLFGLSTAEFWGVENTNVNFTNTRCLLYLYGEGNGTPLQYSCLENPLDGGAWWSAVHGVTKSWTQLSNFTFTFHFHALEKEMATHSSVLAWRIPGTGELGGSMGSHRVGHDWSDLVAAAAACMDTRVGP